MHFHEIKKGLVVYFWNNEIVSIIFSQHIVDFLMCINYIIVWICIEVLSKKKPIECGKNNIGKKYFRDFDIIIIYHKFQKIMNNLINVQLGVCMVNQFFCHNVTIFITIQNWMIWGHIGKYEMFKICN